MTGNIKRNFFVPVDNTFPLLGLAVPLSVVIRQTLRVETIFSAQTGTLEATGEYGFTGDFKAGKENGGEWSAQGPMGVSLPAWKRQRSPPPLESWRFGHRRAARNDPVESRSLSWKFAL